MEFSFAIDWYKYQLSMVNNDGIPSLRNSGNMMQSAVMSGSWGPIATQTASWLVSGAETSSTCSFLDLPIDWCWFHCDPLSYE